MASEIKHNLFLAGYKEAAQHGGIEKWYKHSNCQVVICVAKEIDLPLVEGIAIHHLPIADDDPSENIASIIPDALSIANSAFDEGHNVLVHCRSGASRAPTVILAILVDRYGMSLVDSFHYVSHRRNVMKIFPQYLDQLQNWYLERSIK